jgi:uncharacterized 2Fe-2S/4Fe-4S cluster protein (DUF4445 family)
METRQYPLTLQPTGRQVWALAGTTVLEAVARAGLIIHTPCGGAGTCGKCRVRLRGAVPPPTGADRDCLQADQLDDGWRLACRCHVTGEMTVEIPSSALLDGRERIVTDSTAGSGTLDPAIRKQFLQLSPPGLSDDGADLFRIEQQTGPVRIDLNLLRQLGPTLRASGFQATAVLAEDKLIALEPGDTSAQAFGVAVDLGTTTIVASLLDLLSGTERGLESQVNPQVQFGDDVVSRIQHASRSPQNAEKQRQTIVEALNGLIHRLCATAGIDVERVYEVCLAGNTTMEHLLCGLDVSQLGQVPFVPAFARDLVLPASAMGLDICPGGQVQLFPVIGGFVGGDTVACLLAGELGRCDRPQLLIDVGTNGEIVLCSDERIWAASTAAGPAFEGARIRHGMRAAPGAIEKVAPGDPLSVSVIGNTPAKGICGSGLIDLLAELLRADVVRPNGALAAAEKLPAAWARRIVEGPDGQPAIRVARDGQGEWICLTQRDVREMQLGAGAIRAGVRILLDRAGIQADQLDRVLIAGGFGSFIRRSNAQRIGLLPRQIDHQRIHYVGNASLAGARRALGSVQARERAETLARQAEHVELSSTADFQMVFADSMLFPEQ